MALINGKDGGSKVELTPVISLGNVISIGAMLVTVSATFFTLREDLAVVRTRAEVTSSAVEAIQRLIEQRAPTRYTRLDADRDFAIRDARLESHERRIEALEHQGKL